MFLTGAALGHWIIHSIHYYEIIYFTQFHWFITNTLKSNISVFFYMQDFMKISCNIIILVSSVLVILSQRVIK